MEETIIMDGQKTSAERKIEEMESTSEANKKAALAGVGGFAAGMIATVGVEHATVSAAEPQSEDSEIIENIQTSEENGISEDIRTSEEPEIVDVENVNGTAQVEGSIPIAEVDDSLSFSKAFHSAREQVGPGGVFVWHGKVYNTYTAEEWKSMSSQEHAEFGSHLRIEYDDPVQTTVHVPRSSASHPKHHDPQSPAESTHVEGSHESSSEDDAVVQVLGMEHVKAEDGSEMVVGALGNEQEVVILADINNDGVFDVAAYDENHSGSIEENEIHDISGHQLHVSDMEQAYQMQEGYTDEQYSTTDEAADIPDCHIYDV